MRYLEGNTYLRGIAKVMYNEILLSTVSRQYDFPNLAIFCFRRPT